MYIPEEDQVGATRNEALVCWILRLSEVIPVRGSGNNSRNVRFLNEGKQLKICPRSSVVMEYESILELSNPNKPNIDNTDEEISQSTSDEDYLFVGCRQATELGEKSMLLPEPSVRRSRRRTKGRKDCHSSVTVKSSIWRSQMSQHVL